MPKLSCPKLKPAALPAFALVSITVLLAGCSVPQRISQIDKTPPLTAIENPTTRPGYRPVNLPLPEPEPAVYTANSLWRANDSSFFGDGRAHKVGDILTVNVTIDDEAEFENESERSRTSGVGIGAGTGIIGSIFSLIPGVTDASAIANLNANTNSAGDGSIERSEELNTTIAAVIIQKLPNGNLVIEGRQEVRVNFEVRELLVAGVIRPSDINPDNTIDSTKIAQARIAYGGRGQITNVQRPNYGQQFLDIVSPF
ncbi:MAG: flagellar basal body L-ring protein FlgH [Pseudomonadota bacterium]